MKTLLLRSLVLLTLFVCGKLHAQEKDKLYYDQNGRGLDIKKKAAFYRIVNFGNDNTPIGIVEDFYLNDTLYRKGEAIKIDKFDDTKSRWKGEVLMYNDTGKIIANNHYDLNGLLDSVQTIYNIDNEFYSELNYNHGNPAKDYYSVRDKNGKIARYSYLTHLPIRPTLSTTDQLVVPFALRQTYYQDGQPVQFYNVDGIYVGVKISTQQLYGNYYEVYIEIENGSNPQFDFDPGNITASLAYEGIAAEGEVMTYDDYMKRVRRIQNWTTEFIAFDKYSTVNDVNNMVSQQYDIRKTISEGYLKINTIFPNSRLVGFVNIKYQKADHILLNVPVNGKVYHFEL